MVVESGGAIAIEDTEKGIASAKGAGLACIGLRNGLNSEQDLSAADFVAHGYKALSSKMLRGLVR